MLPANDRRASPDYPAGTASVLIAGTETTKQATNEAEQL